MRKKKLYGEVGGEAPFNPPDGGKGLTEGFTSRCLTDWKIENAKGGRAEKEIILSTRERKNEKRATYRLRVEIEGGRSRGGIIPSEDSCSQISTKGKRARSRNPFLPKKKL